MSVQDTVKGTEPAVEILCIRITARPFLCLSVYGQKGLLRIFGCGPLAWKTPLPGAGESASSGDRNPALDIGIEFGTDRLPAFEYLFSGV